MTAVLMVLLVIVLLTGVIFSYIKNNSQNSQPQDIESADISELTKDTELGTYINEHASENKKDVTIAVIDSGISDTKTIADERLLEGHNFTSEEDITDNFYHGKVINNLITSETDGHVKLLPLKVADAEGNISTEDIADAMSGLRAFMFSSVYTNPKAKSEEKKAKNMLITLYQYYLENFDLLPDEYKKLVETRREKQERIVCDYIAGMSDTYAINAFKELFVPKPWTRVQK